MAVTDASGASACSFFVRRHRDFAPTRPVETEAEAPERAQSGEQVQHTQVSLATDADVCGALGCGEGGLLYRAEREDGEVRTLCVEHVPGWLE